MANTLTHTQIEALVAGAYSTYINMCIDDSSPEALQEEFGMSDPDTIWLACTFEVDDLGRLSCKLPNDITMIWNVSETCWDDV